VTARVSISASAEAQATTVDLWWQVNRRDAPGLFWDEFLEAIDTLETAPAFGERYHRGGEQLRRFLLPKTRYHLYYSLTEGAPPEVVIVAVWSALRGQPPLVE
jgi:hypothetical protein